MREPFCMLANQDIVSPEIQLLVQFTRHLRSPRSLPIIGLEGSFEL